MTSTAACLQNDIEAKIEAKLSDTWWRLSNLYWIVDENGNEVKFRPNWAQTELYEGMWYLNLILKARQLGITTQIQIFMLDACLFHSNIRAGVIAHTKTDAENFFQDKIKFAYDHLPEWLKAKRPANTDSVRELHFSNNSSIRVGTSMRSGTLNYLHISELGKLAAKYPEKAKEIRTGALNTVHAGQFVFIESTAEGKEGEFYDIARLAENHQKQGKELTKMDYKFFFFPWWKHPGYVLDDEVVIVQEYKDYFEKLENDEGIKLTKQQQAWYVKKAEIQQDDMKREYPSTAKEAFEGSVEGSYYARQMGEIRKQGRICSIPYDERLKVHTIWDFGRNDSMAVWFFQHINKEYRFINYMEGSGESIQFYCKEMQRFNYFWGVFHLPHDAEVVEMTREDNLSRAQVVEGLGFNVKVVPRIKEKGDAHQIVRDTLPFCWFDESNCATGIKHLDNYRKEWDDKQGVFKNKPKHDQASHGNDAFEQIRGFTEDTGGTIDINFSSEW